MKVLHVIPAMDPAYGGPAQALAGLAAAQRSAGLDVTILVTMRADDDRLIVDSFAARAFRCASWPRARGP